eukprot:1621480-Alexandrium_andersonii.AAC.1
MVVALPGSGGRALVSQSVRLWWFSFVHTNVHSLSCWASATRCAVHKRRASSIVQIPTAGTR